MTLQNPPTFYDVLGLVSTASLQDIHNAGRRAAAAAHPDRAVQTPEAIKAAVAEFLLISEARACLTDPVLREAYDHRLHVGEPHPKVAEPVFYGDDERWSTFEFHTPTVHPLMPWRPRLRSRFTAIVLAVVVVAVIGASLVVYRPGFSRAAENLAEARMGPIRELVDPGNGAASAALWSGAAPYESAVAGAHPGFSQIGFIPAGDQAEVYCFAHGEGGPVMAYLPGRGYVRASDLIDSPPRDQTQSLNGQACLGNESNPSAQPLTSAAMSSYPIYSEGDAVMVRSSPDLAARVVGALHDGDFVVTVDSRSGSAVPGPKDRQGVPLGPSRLWDRIALPTPGWIPDIEVLSGHP